MSWLLAAWLIISQSSCQSNNQPIESDEAPYPKSPVIAGIKWDPEGAIKRQAAGSDTWPITWADDGHLYTAYADGWGFEPKVPDKLSLGIAKVAGPGDAFEGSNIRSLTGERVGNGKSGQKASGMLMVGGVLYMWTRNANNNGEQCQLAWSADRGESWTWSHWKISELGFCTFLNFGRNYAGARDNYVYMVSHDNPSAYDPADGFILARVPFNQIDQVAAYEFFVALSETGEPVWTSKISGRGHVFRHPGMAQRSGISYNQPLKRYLWWQQIPAHGGDTRFEGGFGIYDAPEPWGPWTTVFYTQNWDVGPGESGSFPTKWISGDGRTAYLLFSGDDSFSVRRATLVLGHDVVDIK